MNSPVNHVMIVPPRLEEIARFPHDTRILPVTYDLFRALSGGRVLVDQAVQNGFPADPPWYGVVRPGASAAEIGMLPGGPLWQALCY